MTMSVLKLLLIIVFLASASAISKRALQKSHEKAQAEKWMEAFYGRNLAFDQVPSLVNLINVVTLKFLSGCTTVILYDSIVEEGDGLLLEQLFRSFPIPYVHGQITSEYRIKVKKLLERTGSTCVSYILFMADVMRSKDIIGEQIENKVIIVARSSQWRVYEFLASEVARVFVNLLVIGKSEKIVNSGIESAYILYTHRMYVDGIGSSMPVVLTSWRTDNFTRMVNLFPMKMMEGFAGHRFIISVAHQPPFVVKRELGSNSEDVSWDGTEIRLAKLLSEKYNFTTDFREAKAVNYLGSGDAITEEVRNKRANLGLGGIYVTNDRFAVIDVSQAHSHDCAAFITLTSTAIPRYRAIMGPFHWSVWLSLTVVYLFAIIPLVLSDKQTLRPLFENPETIENMFWYVFGTFTNCFTFKGPESWGNSEKVTTRVLVGFYWIFTIITTACYTGSIIAFVTLPIIPDTVDTTQQLVSGRYRIGTLDKGGWQHWFRNSTDSYTDTLFKSIEYLPNVQAGLRNVTKAFFWSYAFLGSRDELDFIVRTNFTTQSRRNVLHISNNCFAPYGVAFLFPLNSIYKNTINRGVLNAIQSGFLIKLKSDMEFNIMRSPTGKYLQANPGGTMKLKMQDRALTLDDTQGMFLFLCAGFLMGVASLISEWLGGCVNFCKMRMRRLSTTSIDSHPRSYDSPTPRDKDNCLEYGVHTRLCSISDQSITEVKNEIIQVTENGIMPHNELDDNKIPDVVINNDTDQDLESASESDYDDDIDKAFDLDNIFGELNDSVAVEQTDVIVEGKVEEVKEIE